MLHPRAHFPLLLVLALVVFALVLTLGGMKMSFFRGQLMGSSSSYSSSAVSSVIASSSSSKTTCKVVGQSCIRAASCLDLSGKSSGCKCENSQCK